MVDNDVLAWRRSCPHCGEGFDKNRVVFEPPTQAFSIHASCIQALAAAIQPADYDPAHERIAIERRYHEREQQLFDGNPAS